MEACLKISAPVEKGWGIRALQKGINRCGRSRSCTVRPVLASISRRELGTAAGALAGLRLCTDEASAAEAQLCTRANSYACLDSSSLGYQQLETLSYSFELPDKYVNLVDNGGTDDEVVLRFKSPDDSQAISLVARTASAVRQTFVQVTDISQYGSLEDSKSFLVPREAKIILSETQVYPQPSFDTRTPRGVVQLPDVTMYRYLFRLGKTKLAVSMGALKGKIYYWGVSGNSKAWEAGEEDMLRIWRSFHLVRQGVV